MADVFAYAQQCFIQEQGAFDAIPNTAGAATVANADCCLISSLTTQAEQAEIERPDKTGTQDMLVPQAGRRSGSVSLEMSAAANGAAGVEPDCKKLLKGIFGAAPTIVGATSVTYALGDALTYLSIWDFIDALANATQKVAFNSLVTAVEFTFGGDVPMITFTCEPGWVYDNDQAADGSTPTAAKGGLTAWPAKPASPVVNGTHPRGFDVTCSIAGNAMTNLLSGRIRLEVARQLAKDTNAEFPQAGKIGLRRVTVDLTLADNDTAGMRAVKTAANNRTPSTVLVTLGSVAGTRWVHTLLRVQLNKPRYGTSSDRRSVNLTGMAYPSALGAKDQYTLALT